jgi:hypothetical protein
MTRTKEATPTPDVLVANAFTTFVFTPITARAKQWVDENVQSENWQWFGNALVVEHRFTWGLAEDMKSAGLVLR